MIQTSALLPHSSLLFRKNKSALSYNRSAQTVNLPFGIGCISGSLGNQCKAIALIALLIVSFRVDVNTLTPQHLDSIIFDDDTLYRHISR